MTTYLGTPTDHVEPLAEAFQNAWNDWAGDTGSVPDAFHIEDGKRSTKVAAAFVGSDFVRYAQGWLHAAGFELRKRPVDRGPCLCPGDLMTIEPTCPYHGGAA